MNAGEIVRRLDADQNPRSGRMRDDPFELFVSFPGRGCMWVRGNERYVSGWTDHGAHFGQRFGPVGAWRIRRALRRWRLAHPA